MKREITVKFNGLSIVGFYLTEGEHICFTNMCGPEKLLNSQQYVAFSYCVRKNSICSLFFIFFPLLTVDIQTPEWKPTDSFIY